MPKVPATVKFNDMLGWEFSPGRFVMEDGKIYSRDSLTRRGTEIEDLEEGTETLEISQNALQSAENTKISIELLESPESEPTQAPEELALLNTESETSND